MKLRSLWLLLLVLTALASAGSAQTAYVLSGMVPGLTSPVYLPSAAWPAGFPAPPLALPNFGGVGVPFAPPPAGGAANSGGIMYSTDGVMIAQEPHPLYPGFFCPGGGICFVAVPAPVLLGGGPVTGLAWDSAAGLLWISDAVSVQAFFPPPGVGIPPPLAPAGPPIPIPAGAPISGLGFEAGTGTLWACDVAGMIYNLTPAGALIAMFPMPIPPAGPLAGLTVERTSGQPGDFPPPACSTQIGGFHVLVTDGFMVYDAMNPSPPIPLPMPGLAYGMANGNDAQVSPGATAGNPYTIATNRSTDIGIAPPAAPLLIRIYDPTFMLPPPIAPLLLVNLCPGGPLTPRAPPNLFINFRPLVVVPGMPDPTLPAPFSWMVPLPTLPVAGIQFTAQWLYLDPMTGMPARTDYLTLTAGRP